MKGLLIEGFIYYSQYKNKLRAQKVSKTKKNLNNIINNILAYFCVYLNFISSPQRKILLNRGNIYKILLYMML